MSTLSIRPCTPGRIRTDHGSCLSTGREFCESLSKSMCNNEPGHRCENCPSEQSIKAPASNPTPASMTAPVPINRTRSSITSVSSTAGPAQSQSMGSDKVSSSPTDIEAEYLDIKCCGNSKLCGTLDKHCGDDELVNPEQPHSHQHQHERGYANAAATSLSGSSMPTGTWEEKISQLAPHGHEVDVTLSADEAWKTLKVGSGEQAGIAFNSTVRLIVSPCVDVARPIRTPSLPRWPCWRTSWPGGQNASVNRARLPLRLGSRNLIRLRASRYRKHGPSR